MIDNCTIKTKVKSSKWLLNQFDWAQFSDIKAEKIYFNTTTAYGFKLKLVEDRLTIVNSIHKYFKENNYSHFYYSEVKEAFNKLFDSLGVNINQALIPKFEFGINLLVDEEPQHYLDDIDSIKPKGIVPLDTSHRRSNLYYNTERMKSKLYDKTRESILPYNLLRFEITRKSASKYLKHIQSVEDLLNYDNYISLKDELVKQFNKFQFKTSYDFSNCSSPSEYYRMSAIQSNGLLKTQSDLKNISKPDAYGYQVSQMNKQIKKYIIHNSKKEYLLDQIYDTLSLE